MRVSDAHAAAATARSLTLTGLQATVHKLMLGHDENTARKAA
jgi:hypothetical protein